MRSRSFVSWRDCLGAAFSSDSLAQGWGYLTAEELDRVRVVADEDEGAHAVLYGEVKQFLAPLLRAASLHASARASEDALEVSRTIVFDAPRRARGFFEALIADNLDLGRPASVRHRLRALVSALVNDANALLGVLADRHLTPRS